MTGSLARVEVEAEARVVAAAGGEGEKAAGDEVVAAAAGGEGAKVEEAEVVVEAVAEEQETVEDEEVLGLVAAGEVEGGVGEVAGVEGVAGVEKVAVIAVGVVVAGTAVVVGCMNSNNQGMHMPEQPKQVSITNHSKFKLREMQSMPAGKAWMGSGMQHGSSSPWVWRRTRRLGPRRRPRRLGFRRRSRRGRRRLVVDRGWRIRWRRGGWLRRKSGRRRRGIRLGRRRLVSQRRGRAGPICTAKRVQQAASVHARRGRRQLRSCEVVEARAGHLGRQAGRQGLTRQDGDVVGALWVQARQPCRRRQVAHRVGPLPGRGSGEWCGRGAGWLGGGRQQQRPLAGRQIAAVGPSEAHRRRRLRCALSHKQPPRSMHALQSHATPQLETAKRRHTFSGATPPGPTAFVMFLNTCTPHSPGGKDVRGTRESRPRRHGRWPPPRRHGLPSHHLPAAHVLLLRCSHQAGQGLTRSATSASGVAMLSGAETHSPASPSQPAPAWLLLAAPSHLQAQAGNQGRVGGCD